MGDISKDELRRTMRAARDAFGGDERKRADAKIFSLFSGLFSGFSSYFVYNSFGSEASTGGIISFLVSSGKGVYLPKVVGRDMFPAPYGGSTKGKYGIEEPTGDICDTETDITLVPYLAVDGGGYRIGYGGGYYDRYFSSHMKTLRIGIGYAFQCCHAFERDPGDVPLDAVLTEEGLTVFSAERLGGMDL